MQSPDDLLVELLRGRLAVSTVNNSGDTDRHELLASLSRIEASMASLANALPVQSSVRHLVYVHGICQHAAHFSDPWWEALHDYEIQAFGDGVLGDTRLEVLWSDVITPNSPMAAMALAPALASNIDERSQAASDIRRELNARAARHAAGTVAAQGIADGLAGPSAVGGLLAIPAIGCVDDFAFYLANDAIRAKVIGRFTDVVGPLLGGTADIDIISHSWGTVVAYEGLRQLADQGLQQPRIRNLFTVGSALSISAVKSRLLPQNRDGKRPPNVRRWVNVDARGDIVGGALKGVPFEVNFEYLNVPPFDCGAFLGMVSPVCAHGSYFTRGNAAVNRNIFTLYIDAANESNLPPAPPSSPTGAFAATPPPGGGAPGAGVAMFAPLPMPSGASGSPAQPANQVPLPPQSPPMPKDAAHAAVQQQLGQLTSLVQYRATIAGLSDAERELLIDQAIVMIDHIYAHLPLKRAIYGIDPVQRLRLLSLNRQLLNERDFQSAMIEIFISVRDLHTNYILPSGYSDKYAFVPFRIEEFYEPNNPQRKYAITWVSPLNTNPALKVGLEVTHWNGSPIDMAIERNANREAGSNEEAHRAQGINTLALRWLGMSLPPDEDWVLIDCLDTGQAVEMRFDWRVGDVSSLGQALGGLAQGNAPAALGRVHWGLDLQTAMLQRLRTLIFDPEATKKQANARQVRGTAPGPVPTALPQNQSQFPEIFPTFGTAGRYGYIRLKTFEPPWINGNYDVDAAINEFIRILSLIPQDGLILDVRGNGGGIIAFGERLLQLLASRRIKPEPFYFFITQLALKISQGEWWLNQWTPSIQQGIQTGAALFAWICADSGNGLQ